MIEIRHGVRRVLAINPGSRYMGLAIFYGPELREWCVKTTGTEGGSKRQEMIRTTIENTIERFDIDVVVVKKLHASRSSRFLGDVRKQMHHLGTRKNMPMSEYSIQDLKQFFDPYQTKNKRQLMEEVAIRYPDLFGELECEKKNKNPYRVRMFEAVALGIVHVHQLDSAKQKVGKNIH